MARKKIANGLALECGHVLPNTPEELAKHDRQCVTPAYTEALEPKVEETEIQETETQDSEIQDSEIQVFKDSDLEAIKTTSDKIRFLNSFGWTRAEIAKRLGIRYQHVRGVLVADEEKAARAS